MELNDGLATEVLRNDNSRHQRGMHHDLGNNDNFLTVSWQSAFSGTGDEFVRVYVGR
jgi:hypothetical protein